MRHFQALVLEGLRRLRQKPTNYSKISEIHQGPQENPTTFLEKLWEALKKHIIVDPDSTEGHIILEDKFISHLQTFGGS